MPVSVAIAAIVLLAATIYLAPWVWKRVPIHKLRRQLANRRTIALTYDDGPSVTVTPKLLALLEKHKAKATFFMLGDHAKRYPGIADRVIAAGHQIGCHSEHHLNAWLVRPSRAIADIETCYDSLSRWVAPDAVFRPPYGKTTLPTYLALRRRGAPIAWWTIDSRDTAKTLPQPSEVVDRVLQENGGVILMHDADRSPDRNEFVVEASARLLDFAKREGYRLCTVAELPS